MIVIRGPRLSVTLTDETATVRGYLGTRTIDRSQVVGLTPYPSLLWVDAAGKQHKTPVNALNVNRRSRVLPSILEQIDAMTRTLADWIGPRT
jgi:hypothetical protein